MRGLSRVGAVAQGCFMMHSACCMYVAMAACMLRMYAVCHVCAASSFHTCCLLPAWFCMLHVVRCMYGLQYRGTLCRMAIATSERPSKSGCCSTRSSMRKRETSCRSCGESFSRIACVHRRVQKCSQARIKTCIQTCGDLLVHCCLMCEEVFEVLAYAEGQRGRELSLSHSTGHMCVDMCVDMRVDVRVDMSVDIRVDMRVDICIDMHVDMRVDIFVDMRVDMRVDIRSGRDCHSAQL